jgi:hypothetical protein
MAAHQCILTLNRKIATSTGNKILIGNYLTISVDVKNVMVAFFDMCVPGCKLPKMTHQPRWES